MLAYLFPGQGSQKRGMGAELFSLFPEYVAEADTILGYSMTTLCLENPDQLLDQTQYTQPALYTVNALSYYKKIKDGHRKPDFVCGHSLGEYNALLAANVFDFGTGLKLVKKRGELMGQVKNGGMAAVIGLSFKDIDHLLKESGLNQLVIANDNSYTQVVISGLQKEIEQAKSLFQNKPGVTFIPLSVSGAFHSPFMSDARLTFLAFLDGFKFNVPSIPVIANINASPYHPAVIKTHLANHMTSTVKWTTCMEYLLSHHEIQFEEVGPGTVLTRLLSSIISK